MEVGAPQLPRIANVDEGAIAVPTSPNQKRIWPARIRIAEDANCNSRKAILR